MENIENLLNIYKQLRSCTNSDKVEELKSNFNGSFPIKKRKKESDRDSHKNGGSEELGIRNMRKSRMLAVAETSREVDNLIEVAKELAERGKFGDELTIEVHEEMQVQFPTSNLVGDKFASYFHEISDLLTKNKASTIGVWGMGGVGKTTLIKHLLNMMLDKPQIYGSVYWITVSKDYTIQKLQNDIANKIGASVSSMHDEMQRAGTLAEALRRKKKFVLILDDLWSDLNLNEVGLRFPKEIGYQLIVTSRSKDVCLKMYCDNIIKVDPLSPKDARTLFVRSIGREIPDDLIKISTDMLKECAGLPLGIITLAKSMIGCNDMCEWRYVLDDLRNSSGKVDDMEEKVFNVLRLSYDRVKGCDLKECLLYCSTYPEDYPIPIEELIWLFIDLGLLGQNVGMARLFDKGIAILRKLERVALLSIERFTYFYFDEEVVCLHDLIRDMMLQIAGSRFMIKDSVGLKGIPDEESWTNELEVVSFMPSQFVENFDFSPKCNRLLTLLLKGKYSPNLSDGFFKYLRGLKHLNLSRSYITTLPKSISLLKNLTALILRSCQGLQNVPSLVQLTSLERLDLYQTPVSQLPEGITSLIKLRYLNLSETMIESIGVGVISKLTALQYLAIGARFDTVELNSLNNLEHLTVMFGDFVSFSKFIEQMKIKRRPNSYTIVLENVEDGTILSGKQISLSKTRNGLPDFNLLDSVQSPVFGSDPSMIPCPGTLANLKRRPEIERWVKLFRQNEMQKVLQDIHLLDIHGNGDLMSLGDFVFETESNLQRQSKIGGGPKPFSNLKILRLCACSNLKKLFPLELLSNLQNMEEIGVYFCEGLEEFIEGAHDETKLAGVGHPKKLSILKLRLFRLKNLPNLHRLCSDDKLICTPALRWIHIISCPKLKRMPFELDSQRRPFPDLHYWKEEKEWVESLEWDPPESKSVVHFKNCVNLDERDR